MAEYQDIRTDMGWSTSDRITVRGHDLPTEIIGRLNLGDMAFLELTGRIPSSAESEVFNAIAVTLVEHGITPSALAARLTFLGAPEAMQAAVGAGLCGLGTVFMGSTRDAAAMLLAELPADPAADLNACAARVVATLHAGGKAVPGIGHPVHKPVDPRTRRLFDVAASNGFAGRYVQLMVAIAAEAERVHRRSLPVNATGAIGAICCELGFTANMCHGIAVMARAIGLVGHCVEEAASPMARAVWLQIEEQATRHARAPASETTDALGVARSNCNESKERRR